MIPSPVHDISILDQLDLDCKNSHCYAIKFHSSVKFGVIIARYSCSPTMVFGRRMRRQRVLSLPWMGCEIPLSVLRLHLSCHATAKLFTSTLASVYCESKALWQWEERDRMDGQEMSKTDLLSGD